MARLFSVYLGRGDETYACLPALHGSVCQPQEPEAFSDAWTTVKPGDTGYTFPAAEFSVGCWVRCR